MSKVKLAKVTEVTVEQAVAALHAHMASEPPPDEPEFKRGDIVRLDTGCIGIVHSADEDGATNIYYIDEDGLIQGPSYGWKLTLLPYQG